ncbi:MAG: TetR/AcrR family transcriptional regulator [Actinobacteria bacterium]|nr:TetR/AcrR family transcriptional regulator [Actinomycetota bacterium]
MNMAKRSKSDITRDRLTAAAHDVFVEKGYHRTKVVDIIERAGCGHGTFYDYFKSKDDVLMAILSELIQELVRLGESSRILMERIAFDDYDAIRILLRGISDIFSRHSDLNNVYIEAALESTVFSDVFDQFHGTFTSILESKIQQMKDVGKCEGIDPLVASQILVTLVGFTSYGRQSGFISGSNDEVTENLGLLVFRALNY